MKGIIGKKLGMSQIYDKEGRNIPVTLIQAGPCFVTQIKERSIQIGFDKAKKIKKPLKGHLAKAKVNPVRVLKEISISKGEEYILGQELKVDIFKEEGGRHTPFFTNYRPQFYFRTTDVTGKVTLPEGVEMVMPGDNADLEIELIIPIALEPEQNFAIREGGKTVGAGVVTEIIA